MRAVPLAWLLFLLVLLPDAQARSISVNLRSYGAPPAATKVMPDQVAGVLPVPGQHWNDVVVGRGNLSGEAARFSVSLADDAGKAKAAELVSTLASAAGTVVPGFAGPESTGDDRLMSSFLALDVAGEGVSPDDPGAVLLRGLGPAWTGPGYDVVLYVNGGRDDMTQRVILTPEGGAPLEQRIYNDGLFDGRLNAAGDLLDPADYVVFRDLHAASFQVQVDGEIRRGMLNGIQLVTADHPQPPVFTQLSVDDVYVQSGDPVRVRWQARGAQQVELRWPGGASGPQPASGQLQVVLDQTTEFLLTARGPHGESTATVVATVGPARPNIVVVLVDDMGWQDTSEPFWLDSKGREQITEYNKRYRTPNIEALADQGMKFTDAYAMPVCSPSRASLMTGMNSARHHITSWTPPTLDKEPKPRKGQKALPPEWRRDGLQSGTTALPQLLHEVGYRTIHVGKWHLGPIGEFGARPERLGFDVNIGGSAIGMPGSYLGVEKFGEDLYHVPHLEPYLDQDVYLTDALTQEAGRALDQAVADGAPFFLYMSHYAVHAPFHADQRYLSKYRRLPKFQANFASMIEGVDVSLGELMERLDALGVAEDTLIVFMSDNGSAAPIPCNHNAPTVAGSAPLRGKKSMRYEGGTRVPMIVSWAAPNPQAELQRDLEIPQGSVVRDMVAIFDLYPTLLAVAGVDGVDPQDGTDLSPYLWGLPGHHRQQELLMHMPHWRANPAWTWLRQGNMKVIYDYEADRWELYDLAADISEENDLSPLLPDTLQQLARRMRDQLVESDAQYPLRAGTGQPMIPPLPQPKQN